MAKIRNSLGVLVLPIPNDDYTWEEYKQLYGVDLSSIFPTIVSGSHVTFNTAKWPTKLLCISGLVVHGQYPDVVPVSCVDVKAIKDGDDETIGRKMLIAVTGYSEDGEASLVIGRLRLSIFDDPDTENRISYSEL